MSKPLILVTGATGKTGVNVVEQLVDGGFLVRALARTRDERTERLEKVGAEVVLGDFLRKCMKTSVLADKTDYG